MKGWLCFVAGWVCVAAPSWAQTRGFSLNRYEPAGAGQSTFRVEHPWYAAEGRSFALDLTLDFAHHPLVLGAVGRPTTAVIAQQLIAHVGGAYSPLDRLLLTASLPLVLHQDGTPAAGVTPSGQAIGDPRVGALVRLHGDPSRDVFSLSAGADFWIPVGTADQLAGDRGMRLMPKLVAAGVAEGFRWSALAAYQYRRNATLGSFNTSVVGQEISIGGALAYADVRRGYSVGPEVTASTAVSGPPGFRRNSSSIEAVLGGSYRVLGDFQIGAGIGFGFLSAPGTAQFRGVVRVAYDPERVPDSAHARPFTRAEADGAEAPAEPEVARPSSAPVKANTENAAEAGDAGSTKEGATRSETRPHGRPPVLAPLFFKAETTELLPESIPVLDDVARALASTPQLHRISIHGHSDTSGSADRNRMLSKRRAEAVRQWLIERGVEGARLAAEGFGADQPLAPNDTPEGRAKNRRVEFVVINPATSAEPRGSE